LASFAGRSIVHSIVVAGMDNPTGEEPDWRRQLHSQWEEDVKGMPEPLRSFFEWVITDNPLFTT
jgi:hypothetical protein